MPRKLYKPEEIVAKLRQVGSRRAVDLRAPRLCGAGTAPLDAAQASAGP